MGLSTTYTKAETNYLLQQIDKRVVDRYDEEDLTIVVENGTKKLKFADRPNTDGLGYKILLKNIVGGKNVLTQSMISQDNTIYEIRYDFDLNGGIITIPNNCILKFTGGKLKNGVLSGANTTLDNSGNYVILDNVRLKNEFSGMFSDSWITNVSDDLIFDCFFLFNEIKQTKSLIVLDNANKRELLKLNFKWTAFGGAKITLKNLTPAYSEFYVMQPALKPNPTHIINWEYHNVIIEDFYFTNSASVASFGFGAYNDIGAEGTLKYKVLLSGCQIKMAQNSLGMVSSSTTNGNEVTLINSRFESKFRFSLELWNSRASKLRVLNSEFLGNVSLVQDDGRGFDNTDYIFENCYIKGSVELAEDKTLYENIYNISFYNCIIKGDIPAYRQTYDLNIENCIMGEGTDIYGLKSLTVKNSKVNSKLIGKFVNDNAAVSKVLTSTFENCTFYGTPSFYISTELNIKNCSFKEASQIKFNSLYKTTESVFIFDGNSFPSMAKTGFGDPFSIVVDGTTFNISNYQERNNYKYYYIAKDKNDWGNIFNGKNSSGNYYYTSGKQTINAFMFAATIGVENNESGYTEIVLYDTNNTNIFSLKYVNKTFSMDNNKIRYETVVPAGNYDLVAFYIWDKPILLSVNGMLMNKQSNYVKSFSSFDFTNLKFTLMGNKEFAGIRNFQLQLV